jgi:hypothetical protein
MSGRQQEGPGTAAGWAAAEAWADGRIPARSAAGVSDSKIILSGIELGTYERYLPDDETLAAVTPRVRLLVSADGCQGAASANRTARVHLQRRHPSPRSTPGLHHRVQRAVQCHDTGAASPARRTGLGTRRPDHPMGGRPQTRRRRWSHATDRAVVALVRLHTRPTHPSDRIPTSPHRHTPQSRSYPSRSAAHTTAAISPRSSATSTTHSCTPCVTPMFPATRGSAHRPRTARIGCLACTHGNSSASPGEASATGRPASDPVRGAVR